jgi:hypothetical protein
LNEDLIRENPKRAIRFDLYEENWHLRQVTS